MDPSTYMHEENAKFLTPSLTVFYPRHSKYIGIENIEAKPTGVAAPPAPPALCGGCEPGHKVTLPHTHRP